MLKITNNTLLTHLKRVSESIVETSNDIEAGVWDMLPSNQEDYLNNFPEESINFGDVIFENSTLITVWDDKLGKLGLRCCNLPGILRKRVSVVLIKR